jgi:hypothetical protein
MLIRNVQLEALTAPLREKFAEDLTSDLATLFPGDQRFADRTAARVQADAAISRAREYKLEARRPVLLFAALCFHLGAGFETNARNAWMLSLLRDDELDEGEKMDVIYARLAAEEKREKGAKA